MFFGIINMFCIFRNSCFGGEDRLMGDGVFDVTICQFDAPIVLSWPHFLGAESKFSDAVTGLSPDKVSGNFIWSLPFALVRN